jgi:hypothetical protein
MATYNEIRDLFSNDEFKNRVTTACVVSAYNLIMGTPTANDNKFADSVFANADAMGRKVTMAVLAANKAATTAQVLSATDETIQAQVDLIIPSLVDALAGV